MELIERCLKLLETNGREPKEWPVPISRDDLRALIEYAQKWENEHYRSPKLTPYGEWLITR